MNKLYNPIRVALPNLIKPNRIFNYPTPLKIQEMPKFGLSITCIIFTIFNNKLSL